MELEHLKPKIEELKELFGLQNWRITATMDPRLNANARTYANSMYLHAEMTFKMMPTEWTLLHEFIHIAMASYDHLVDNTSPMDTQSYIQMAREQSVSQLTEIFMRLKK